MSDLLTRLRDALAEVVADTCRLTAWLAWRDAYKERDRKKEAKEDANG